MEEKTTLKIMFWFTISYLLFFTVNSLMKKNYEFLYYTAIMAFAIFIIVFYYKKIHLEKYIITGLFIIGILHIFSGNIFIGETRLYDLWIIKGIFKFDNLVHIISMFIATVIAYNFLHPHLTNKIKHDTFSLTVVLILLGSGIGALNEVSELVAVIFFNAAENVGNYMNNAMDLFYNLIGVSIACLFILRYREKLESSVSRKTKSLKK